MNVCGLPKVLTNMLVIIILVVSSTANLASNCTTYVHNNLVLGAACMLVTGITAFRKHRFNLNFSFLPGINFDFDKSVHINNKKILQMSPLRQIINQTIITVNNKKIQPELSLLEQKLFNAKLRSAKFV